MARELDTEYLADKIAKMTAGANTEWKEFFCAIIGQAWKDALYRGSVPEKLSWKLNAWHWFNGGEMYVSGCEGGFGISFSVCCDSLNINAGMIIRQVRRTVYQKGVKLCDGFGVPGVKMANRRTPTNSFARGRESRRQIALPAASAAR